MNGLAFLWK